MSDVAAVETDSAELTELPEILFRSGLPGFPDAHRFVLRPWTDAETPFSVLSSLDQEELEFLVVSPDVFFADYAFDISDEMAGKLGLERPEDAVVLVIITVGDEVAKATANLLGPIVINASNHEAAQIVLASSGYDVRTRLFPDA